MCTSLCRLSSTTKESRNLQEKSGGNSTGKGFSRRKEKYYQRKGTLIVY
uniref:Uncharacterized protein n=1 Tax=Arundo donax TaxID=35708 RepID=A0A0A9AIK8_ARUDO